MSDHEKYNYYKNKDTLDKLKIAFNDINDIDNKLKSLYLKNLNDINVLKKNLEIAMSNYYSISKNYGIDIYNGVQFRP